MELNVTTWSGNSSRFTDKTVNITVEPDMVKINTETAGGISQFQYYVEEEGKLKMVHNSSKYPVLVGINDVMNSLGLYDMQEVIHEGYALFFSAKIRAYDSHGLAKFKLTSKGVERLETIIAESNFTL